MFMTQSLGQKQAQAQRLQISMPYTQWSLVRAFRNSYAGPQPPPMPDENLFEATLDLKQELIPGFENFDHEEKMRLIDKANKVFRFVYTRGLDWHGQEKYYFKIPLLRDINIARNGIDKIKIRITRAEYEQAVAIIRTVGELERIARAVPYHGLYETVVTHLKKDHDVDLNQTVLVSVDRGGRIPCLILQHALGLTSMETLKVDQGHGQLDVRRLTDFAANNTFRDKHVLFVDSTVDSGRQIKVLANFFDDPWWQEKLGHRSWSLVGSNEYGNNLAHHHNINWGVDPDSTFEDNPELMGIDYAPNSLNRVVECPSITSEAIKKCLLAVPAGLIYNTADVAEQVERQYREWKKARAERKAQARRERRQADKERKEHWTEQSLIITAIRQWSERYSMNDQEDLLKKRLNLPPAALPTIITDEKSPNSSNILIIGTGGGWVDIPEEVADFLISGLSHFGSLSLGTVQGNPGRILERLIQTNAKIKVRLYRSIGQQSWKDYFHNDTDRSIIFAGETKTETREQMIKDAKIVLVLGGSRGTMEETLLALKLQKPTVLIKDWGAIPGYLLKIKRYRTLPHLKVCENIVEALQTVLEITKT